MPTEADPTVCGASQDTLFYTVRGGVTVPDSHGDKEGGGDVKDADEEQNADGEEGVHEQEEEEDDPPVKLYKSTRLKGYFTLVLASSLNYVAAYQSDDVILANAVPATDTQKRYAEAASMVSIILSFAAVLFHLDQWTPLQAVWIKAFRPSSPVELCFILFLLIWWFIATWIQTSIEGIAGDGKGQYNLYFSTWACFITCIWTLDRWLVAKGLSSFKDFLASWPNRAPGWIAIFLLAFAAFLSILNLFLNWKDASEQSDEAKVIAEKFESVSSAQWNWLLVVTSLTLPPAAGFVLVELFREKKTSREQNEKPEIETIFEGVCLVLLVLGWVPSVIIATTPGGAASQVGNAYFFTWACTVFVMETSVWWIHDWRKSIHQKIRQQEEEYKKIQEEVLQKSRAQIKNGESDNKNADAKGSPSQPPNAGLKENEKQVSFARSRLDDEMDIGEDETDSHDDLSEYDDGVIPDVIGT